MLYFFGWWQEAGDGRDISNFLITPRGANDLHPLLLPFLLLVLSSSLTPPFRSVPSSCSATLSSAGSLYRTDTPWRRSTTSPNHLPTAPFFNLTPTSHQGEPLLYLLLRYRPALSPARYYVQYAAGNTRSIHTSREREYPRFDPSLLVPPLSLSLSLFLALSLSLSLSFSPLHNGGAFRGLLFFRREQNTIDANSCFVRDTFVPLQKRNAEAK